jgi:hypothetical protein
MGDPNLKLFCEAPTGATTTDVVGNRKPVYQTVEVLLSVREDKEARSRVDSGMSTKSLPLIGRFVDPKIFPSWLKSKRQVKAELTDPMGNIQKGSVDIDAIAQHRVSIFSEVRGSLFKGTFTEVM